MKLLASLFFTAFCLLSTLNAAEPLLNNPQPTTISIGTATVEITRDDVSQAAIDLSHLKFCSTMCATLWAMHLATCCSEYGQTEYLDEVTGLLSAYTFDLALKYFKLKWLPSTLSIPNVTPHAALVALTVLPKVANTYDLHYLVIQITAFEFGVWFSLIAELHSRFIVKRKQHQNATKNNSNIVLSTNIG
jgi:hypothetical protein